MPLKPRKKVKGIDEYRDFDFRDSKGRKVNAQGRTILEEAKLDTERKVKRATSILKKK